MQTFNTAARDPWAHEEVEAGGYQPVPSIEHSELETEKHCKLCRFVCPEYAPDKTKMIHICLSAMLPVDRIS